MQFANQQAVAVSPAQAMAAYGTPAFYEGRTKRDNIEVIEVVRHEDTGARVLMEVRFAFRGPISPAVQRIIDRNKMSWITRNEIKPDESRADWQVLPDHYPDRLSADGVYRFEPGGDGPKTSTVVGIEGDLKVHVPILGRSVEKVIVSGLRKYFAAEVLTIPDL
ncbi:MAG TPA: DUF2505 family protein [Acidimicrobiales bacterium]|nr:DUF2505 family protein [Acidimicrobiales bacterium]